MTYVLFPLYVVFAFAHGLLGMPEAVVSAVGEATGAENVVLIEHELDDSVKLEVVAELP